MSDTTIKKRPLYIRYAGPTLLETPLLNKGNAFTSRERQEFNLEGLMPSNVETIEEQSARSYIQFCQFSTLLDKHIFLRGIQDMNETLFFKLISEHLEEMMPVIYTPTVGLACQKFSEIYRRKRGLFLTYPDQDRIDMMLQNLTKQNVKVIVITDSERILGLGDQGIGGMGIPIGKLSLYTACGGISPAYTLPITLDVGTNNQELLDDPLYMGWRHKRISGKEYFDFVDDVIKAIKLRWPNVIIQFEDFAQNNATPLLHKYKDKISCFNDDIQGTAAVTVGTLIAACKLTNTKLSDHRIMFIGAGSAGTGVAEQLIAHTQQEGLTEEEAISKIFLTTRNGLLIEGEEEKDFQKKFAKPMKDVADWTDEKNQVSLLELTKRVKPTILIGVSGVPGLMSEEMIKTMYKDCAQPIVMPLSNPTSRAEAIPSDVIKWTEGNAIVATGSPFDPVEYNGKTYEIAQCNNVYIFPGIGLGIIACGANRITDTMFMVASETLAAASPVLKGEGKNLLPDLEDIQKVTREIGLQVALQAMHEGVALNVDRAYLEKQLDKNFWYPAYREYRRTPN